jgi:hypothetical protein
MGPGPRRLDAWLIVLGSTSVVAWSVLTLDGSNLTMPAFCSAGTLRPVPLSVSLDLALLFNPPRSSLWAGR